MNGISWEGGFLILEYQKSFSPLPNLSHALEINVALTPIKFIAGGRAVQTISLAGSRAELLGAQSMVFWMNLRPPT
jgi:hypothetical protein